MNIRTDGRHVTVDLTPYEVYLLVSYAEATMYKDEKKAHSEIDLEKMLRALKAGAALVSP